VIRLILLKGVDVEATGLYQSAWALGGLYIGFILQAMGADFYPRLTGVAKDNPECNRLVNEQAQVSLLLAGPGVLGTLTLAPLVITMFYSAKFAGAVEPLRWICLGMVLRVISWPMGFIILAKGVRSLFFLTEGLAAVVQVGLTVLFVRWFGVTGAGMAFFGLYVVHGCVVYIAARKLSGFRWSPANRRTGAVVLSLIGAVFCAFNLLPLWIATGLGVLASLFCGYYSTRVLVRLVPFDRLPRPMRTVLTWFRFTPPGNAV